MVGYQEKNLEWLGTMELADETFYQGALVIVMDTANAARIDNKNFFRSTVLESTRTVKINEVLPFRIRFTEVRVPGYSPNNVPGIGLQIIEYSNYIL